MHKEETTEAIFGGFDGLTSVLGVIVVMASHKGLMPAVVGLAVASAVGMGAGQYLSDPSRRLHLALVMSVATLVGTLLPAIPLFISNTYYGLAFSILVSLFMCLAIAYFRTGCTRRRAVIETYSILLLAGGLSALVGVLIPSSLA